MTEIITEEAGDEDVGEAVVETKELEAGSHNHHQNRQG